MESNTKTSVPNNSVKKYFCKGCNKEHVIDGFLWKIESEVKPFEISNSVIPEKTPCKDNLILEDIKTHFIIKIDKNGGTIGRYGDYGAEYFRANFGMVSGKHCRFRYENGNWIVQHISRTNDTKYCDMRLERQEERIIENGRILNLANAVSFLIRIE